MNEKYDPRVDDIIGDPDAAINQPEWTHQAAARAVIAEGPNVGFLTPEAATVHGQYSHDSHEGPFAIPEAAEAAANSAAYADYIEFDEAIRAAVHMDVAFLATPEITEEEAIRRLKWTRERAKAAVDEAKLIQKTANEARAATSGNLPSTPTPVAEGVRVEADEPLQGTAKEVEPTPEHPKKKENANESMLRSGLQRASSIDEITDTIKHFQASIVGSGTIYSPSRVIDYIKKAQGDERWLQYVTNTYGIRDAVVRVMNLPNERRPQAPEPESPTPATPEVKYNFRDIPLKDGSVVFGDVISASPNSVLIMTPQGKMEIGRSRLLNYNEIYSAGAKADLDALESLQQEEARKREEQERQRRQNDPPAMHMSAGT
jgi:hypothetical protein